ncbi:MAG TPA: tRNA pseudouridine(38-40) synthase TruA [Caulobacteraceae bacterium]|nr:tRNA pseudouridine(38-40) synthase TruA [Caulobacteraceae bacterium]
MPRYKLLIEYDGAPYKGFQLQAEDIPSVQGSLERAIAAFTGERPTLYVAGRTDTGVHATGQVAHFENARVWKPQVVRDAINAHLVPEPIAVIEAEVAPDDFHARFSATGRRYLYRVLNRRAPPALEQGRVWHVKKRLDHEAMHAAAQRLVGKHDFTTFRDMQCQAKSPVKTLDVARVWREGEDVLFEFASRSFLHRQVRSMVGSLVEVGAGRWSEADFVAALEARDRTRCGQVAPPQGLVLTKVEYGAEPEADLGDEP